MKAQKQILSNSTPINFFFTEFELVHYSLIDWLSYACQASFRLIGWLNRFKETHCASWLRNWAVSVSLRLMPGIKMQCNAHLNKLHSSRFERNESICTYANRVIACLISPHFIERAEVYNFVLQCFYFIINEKLEYLKMNEKVWICKICWIIKISFTDVVFLNSIR